MSSPIIPILLAGGGTRLASVAQSLPKQFCWLAINRIPRALLRVRHPIFASPIVITGQISIFARRQAGSWCDAIVVIEPMPRLGPAIAPLRSPPTAIPTRGAGAAADQSSWTSKRSADRRAGRAAAEAGALIPRLSRQSPDRLRLHSSAKRRRRRRACGEKCGKPDTATAARYVREGYLWNSATFCFAPTFCFRVGARHCGCGQTAVVAPAMILFRGCSRKLARAAKSIDYAVMEKPTAPPGGTPLVHTAAGTRCSTSRHAIQPATLQGQVDHGWRLQPRRRRTLWSAPPMR
jgi:hypothetical protein